MAQNATNGLSRPDLDNLLEGCQIIGFDWRYVYLNKTAQNHNHIPNEELLGKKYEEIWPGIEKTEVYRLIKSCLEERTAHHFENEFTYPNGKIGWFDLSIQPVPEGVFILSIDITERILMTRELLLKEEHFRSLFEQASDGIFIADEKGNYTDVNEAGCKMLGYSKEELTKLNIIDITTVDERLRVEPAIEELRRVKLLRQEWKFQRKNKTVFIGEVTTKLLPSGHLQAYLRDITELKMTEIALSESERKFKNLVSDMQVGVVIQGPGSEVLLSNTKALELLGLTEEQLLGKTSFDPDWNVIHEDGSPYPGPTHPVAQSISTRKPVRDAVMGVYRPTFGDRMWLLVDALPQLNDDGAVRQVICTFIDINKRKIAEEALRKSEDLFNKAFHGSPSPMTIASQKDGKYIAVNDSFLRLVGMSRDQVIGQTGSQLDLIDNESRAKILSVLKSKGNLHNIEVLARSKKGKLLYLLTSIENTDLAGEPSTIATMLDITERKFAEEALSQSETKFRKIYEEGPFGMALVNSEFRILNANATYCRIMGYSERELQGMTFKDITFNTIDNEEQLVKKLIKGEIPVFKTEKQYRRKDGKVIWASLTVTANFNHDGQFLYNLAIVEDISARKHAEEELLENKAYLDAALASMIDAVFISDRSGKFILFNDAFATFHRFPDKDTCSKQFSDYPDILNVFFSNGEPAPVEQWAVSRALRGEIASNEEYIIQRKDTGEKWIGSYNFSPIRDMNGEIMGSVVVGRDITYLKDNEKKINSLNETLEQRVEERTAQLKAVNKELEAFSYSVSHDLRAPLRSINGFTQILMEDYAPGLDEEGLRICNIIQQSSQKMGMLIDELLAFSRLNRSEMVFSEIKMKELINSTYNELLDGKFSKKIEFNVGDICDSEGDANLIKQVWTNLLSNAIKYSSKNDHIKIDISCIKSDGINTYSIKDNGVGFDMEFKDKLFGVFQRLHSINDFEGTGVGLAIVQRIVSRHGGDVWAKGEVGHGAEFYFSLPRKQKIVLNKLNNQKA